MTLRLRLTSAVVFCLFFVGLVPSFVLGSPSVSDHSSQVVAVGSDSEDPPNTNPVVDPKKKPKKNPINKKNPGNGGDEKAFNPQPEPPYPPFDGGPVNPSDPVKKGK